ncbi:MAG: hypothetical protein IPO83_06840 [Chitinophagaceae bacterium]|nr:hypothetical protein [Chitinophagaceae bacterium]
MWSGQFHAVAQGCSSASGAVYKGILVPTTTFQSVAGANAGDYWKFDGASCNKYVFSFCPGDGGTVSWNTELTIDDNAGAANTGGYNDDYCSVKSYLEWTPTSNSTYRIYITKTGCSNISASSGTLVYKVIPQNTVTSEYALVGTAVAPSGCATLTANAVNNIGCAWDVNSNLDFSAAFSYDFTVNLGSVDGGADGISFVMQNDPLGLCACGTSGGGMGAAGITKSVIIEMDTYLNYEDRDDGMAGVACSGGAEPDHIDLWLNGNVNPTGVCGSIAGARIIPAAVPLMNGASLYNIENGLDHTLRISWIPSGVSGTLTASLLNAGATITYGTFSYAFNPTTVFGTQTPYYGFTASTGALTNQQSACLSTLLLPVEIASFTASCNQGTSVVLQWKTLSEINNQYFSIERSEDGIQFAEVMKLEGAGTSMASHEYSWTDLHHIPGTAYYRLVQNAGNNGKTYSPAISVTCENASQPSITAYEDGNGYLNISLDGPSISEGTVQVVDVNGRVLVTLPFDQLQEDEHVAVNFYTGKLPSGIYVVTLKNHAQFYCTRIAVFY